MLASTDRTYRPRATTTCSAANFVADGDAMWLIDYEYSGNNDPCFELGNTSCECRLFRRAAARTLVTHLLRPPVAKQDRPRPTSRGRRDVRLGVVGMHPERFQLQSTSISGNGVLERYEGAVAELHGTRLQPACSTTCRATD